MIFLMKCLTVAMKKWTRVKFQKKKILVMKMTITKIIFNLILMMKTKILKILIIMNLNLNNNNYNNNNNNFSKNILINNQPLHFNRILISVIIQI